MTGWGQDITNPARSGNTQGIHQNSAQNVDHIRNRPEVTQPRVSHENSENMNDDISDNATV